MSNSADDKAKFSSDILNETTTFIDRHLREIRWILNGVLAVGVVWSVRKLYLFRKICHASDIPKEFIQNNVRLHGIVKNLTDQGLISVDHTPVITTRWNLSKKESPAYLPVKLCGVDVESESFPWLQTNLKDKHVWFRLMRTNEKEEVECIVTSRKYILLNRCINVDLVKNGLGTVKYVPELSENEFYIQLSDKLVSAQLYADKKGLGMWKRPTLLEKMSKKSKEVKTSISKRTTFLNGLFNGRMVTWKREKTKEENIDPVNFTEDDIHHHKSPHVNATERTFREQKVTKNDLNSKRVEQEESSGVLDLLVGKIKKLIRRWNQNFRAR